MHPNSHFDIHLVLIGLGLAIIGVAMTAFPPDYPNMCFRKIFGWTLFGLGGLFTFFVAWAIVSQDLKELFGVFFPSPQNTSSIRLPISKVIPTPTPTPIILNKQPQDEKPISVWFLEDNPTFNLFLENIENNKPAPKIEMVFNMEIVNNTDKDQTIFFVPDYGDAKLSKKWSIKPLAIEPITSNIRPFGNNGFILEPKRHFNFKAHAIIYTDDPNTKDFKDSFNVLSKEMNFGLLVHTGQNETYEAHQLVFMKAGFLGNLFSNWRKYSDSW